MRGRAVHMHCVRAELGRHVGGGLNIGCSSSVRSAPSMPPGSSSARWMRSAATPAMPISCLVQILVNSSVSVPARLPDREDERQVQQVHLQADLVGDADQRRMRERARSRGRTAADPSSPPALRRRIDRVEFALWRHGFGATTSIAGMIGDLRIRLVDDHGPRAVRVLVGGRPRRPVDRAAPAPCGWWPPRSRRTSGPRCRGTCRGRSPRPSARRPSARRSGRGGTRRASGRARCSGSP